MGIQGMKVHRHVARGFWDQHQPPSTLRCHRRPLAVSTATHLKSFIRPQNSGPRKPGSPHKDSSSPQVEGQSGGTRWNPTQEQIGYLEMLYRSGIRTPHAQQIEHITAHLGKFGKIEGKNVFYWFQNHKARERQKQKRVSMAQNNSNTNAPQVASPSPPPSLGEVDGNGTLQKGKVAEKESGQCTEEEEEEEGGIRTLELFPLHPEGRSSDYF